MDFFDHQEQARKRTSLLLVYFVIAVGLIILSVYAVISAFIVAGGDGPAHLRPVFFEPERFFAVAIGVVFVILLGTLYQLSALGGGGAAVARMLGGEPVQPNTTDPTERKLLNVVEEMAIAAGTPVPEVYLLGKERSINAFAAGTTPANAVVGVTRGTMELLTRDELQGVIAHEFSHILNGDMRLNIRLIGILHGILLISMIGYFTMRLAPWGGSSRSRSSSDRNSGGAALAMLAIGAALWAIGYIGVVFGRLIKSAVSRQREYLADASAVQFTRNPDGLAGALKKIGGLSVGARLRAQSAEEASHLFFGNALKPSMFNAIATHPPIQERIKRIDPAWDGEFPEVRLDSSMGYHKTYGQAPTAEGGPGQARRPPMAAAMAGLTGAVLANQVGAPQQEHIAYASKLIQEIPGTLREMAREPEQARALILGLLLDPVAELRERQLQTLRAHAETGTLQALEAADAAIDQLKPQHRLPLADMAIPALRRLSNQQYERFRANVDRLILADEEIDLFEYALQRMLLRHLDAHFGRFRPSRIRHYTMDAVRTETAVVLSTLAQVGSRDENAAQRAFIAAAHLTELSDLELMPRSMIGLDRLNLALNELAAGAASVKRTLIEACSTCVLVDGKITIQESELLRAIADFLGCPMPPVLAEES